LIALLILAAIADPVWIGRFGGQGQPAAPWRVVHLDRKVPATTYRRTTLLGVQAIEARSQRSMALLARPIAIDLAATPMLCWRWFVDAPVARADMTRKSGDDYAARLYVAFDVPDARMSAGTRVKLRLARSLFGRDVPDAALNYVWDNRHPVGTRRRSPYTDRAQLVVAETGTGRAGQWVEERADIAADFDKAFGGTAKPIQLAIASDTDNTGGTARAAFADVHFVARTDRCRF
jgi:hypothetical protein